MVEEDKLKFGKPRTYSQAIMRLPSIEDKAIQQDDGLLALAFLRNNLESVKKSVKKYGRISLEERLTKLTPNGLKLLEERSFRRGKELFSAEWTKLDVKSRWAYFYGINYANWLITEILPALPENNIYQIVCIQTSSDENYQFTIGLVDKNEFLGLKRTLLQNLRILLK